MCHVWLRVLWKFGLISIILLQQKNAEMQQHFFMMQQNLMNFDHTCCFFNSYFNLKNDLKDLYSQLQLSRMTMWRKRSNLEELTEGFVEVNILLNHENIH